MHKVIILFLSGLLVACGGNATSCEKPAFPKTYQSQGNGLTWSKYYTVFFSVELYNALNAMLHNGQHIPDEMKSSVEWRMLEYDVCTGSN